MPNQQEYNQFRRLTGTYDAATPTVSNATIVSYLNDACLELTSDFSTPIIGFDILVEEFHPEVVIKAAINWWWNRLADLQDRHSISTGTMAQNVSEKWDRGMKMLDWLYKYYDDIAALKQDVWIGNFSRYSKQTLRRVGGIREEDTNA